MYFWLPSLYVDIFFVAKIPENKVAKIAAVRTMSRHEKAHTRKFTYYWHDIFPL